MGKNTKTFFFNACKWNKESLFEFLKLYVKEGYKIVYHQNNVVLVNITQQNVMKSLTMGIVKKLCYGTIPEVWDYYINESNTSKYFLLFNFNVAPSSSKSIYAILAREDNNNILHLDAVDKYHKFFYGDEMINKLDLMEISFLNGINRGGKPTLVNPNVQLGYLECVKLEKRILRI